MTASGWAAALDAFAHRLAEQRAAVAAGDLEAVRAFSPPPGLGPLPPSLAARARALLADAEALTDALADNVRSTGEQRALLARLQPAAPGASFVDASF